MCDVSHLKNKEKFHKNCIYRKYKKYQIFSNGIYQYISIIRAITPFRVIEVGINRKLVCDFLLGLTDILSCTVLELLQLCSYFGHFAFFSPPLGA